MGGGRKGGRIMDAGAEGGWGLPNPLQTQQMTRMVRCPEGVNVSKFYTKRKFIRRPLCLILCLILINASRIRTVHSAFDEILMDNACRNSVKRMIILCKSLRIKDLTSFCCL